MRTHFILTAGELTWQFRRALETARVHSWEPLLWHVGPEPDDAPVETRPIAVPAWLLDSPGEQWLSPQIVYDCLALEILQEHGGMTLGLDTISVRDATDLLGDHGLVMSSDWPANRPTWDCSHPFNNHLLAQPEATVVTEMLLKCRQLVAAREPIWGATGPRMLTEFWQHPDVGVAPFPALCGWEGSDIWKFYRRYEEPGPNVRVIHLYRTAYLTDYEHFEWEPLTV